MRNFVSMLAQSAWVWFRGQSRNMQIVVGVVVLILVCGTCGVLSNAAGGGRTSAPITEATATATATLSPPTATPTGIRTATLGGTEAMFTAAYGSPQMISQVRRIYTTEVAGQAVAIMISLDDKDGTPQRVRYIHLAPAVNSVTWDAQTADKVAKALLPPDAKYSKDVQVPDFGNEHVYTSTQLAASFPASQFEDVATSKQLTLGTFYYACGDQIDGAGSCSIQVGQ